MTIEPTGPEPKATGEQSGHAHDGHSVVRVHLMGSQPAPTSPVITGINPRAAPWRNDRSTARVPGRTRDTIAVPEECADPTVLIQPAANRTV